MPKSVPGRCIKSFWDLFFKSVRLDAAVVRMYLISMRFSHNRFWGGGRTGRLMHSRSSINISNIGEILVSHRPRDVPHWHYDVTSGTSVGSS